MRHPYEWVVSFLTRKPVFVQWSLTWPRRKVRTVSARTQFFRARSVISSYWSGQTGFFSNLFLLDFFEVLFFSWFFNCGTFQTINKFCIQTIMISFSHTRKHDMAWGVSYESNDGSTLKWSQEPTYKNLTLKQFSQEKFSPQTKRDWTIMIFVFMMRKNFKNVKFLPKNI